MISETIFQLKDVVKVYETGSGGFTALKGVSFEVRQGEFLGIIGKSGAGKTTLLNMLSGVSEITSGEVRYWPQQRAGQNGQANPISIGRLDQDGLARWRGQHMGIVYQSFELMPQLNLVNNIMLPQDFAGRFRSGISQQRAMELLELVELQEHAYKVPAHISGGQKQRVAIARALVNDPQVIVADEPTGSLDSVTAETIFHIFARLVDQGKTVIMVTHDRELAPYFSRSLVISDGRLVEDHAASRESQDSPVEGVAPPPEARPQGTANGNGRAARPVGLPQQPVKLDEPAAPAIQLQNVVKTYTNAAGSFTALKGIDLEIQFGQFVSLVGKSGSGKSTLLNMLTGIDHPTSGKVLIGGEDIYQLSESQRALWRGRTVGIVFQFFQLLPTLTLLENTILPMDYCDIHPYQERPERAMDLLKLVGLEAHAYDLPANVSNGQQQAAAIARSLATDPPIIVADEPTGNLDSRSADIVIELFQDLAARGKTILIVTHDPTLTSRTDRNVIIADGQLIDPTVANLLPTLDHPQMLKATHSLVRRSYAPGQTIIHQDERVDHLYLVTNGQVEVTDGQEWAVAQLSPGEFFGEVELMGEARAIATVRTGTVPVELALLPRENFNQIMHESPAVWDAVGRVAQQRREENRVRRLKQVGI